MLCTRAHDKKKMRKEEERVTWVFFTPCFLGIWGNGSNSQSSVQEVGIHDSLKTQSALQPNNQLALLETQLFTPSVMHNLFEGISLIHRFLKPPLIVPSATAE